VLMLQGRQDRTVLADAMPRYNEQIASTDKQMVWIENSGHLVLEDYSKEQAFARILEFVGTRVQSKPRFERRNYADVMAEFLR
jgi:esterase/lipase